MSGCLRSITARCRSSMTVHTYTNRLLSSQASAPGARRPQNPLSSVQVVDPRYVNAHQCTLNQDATTQQVLRRIRRSLSLLEKGQYSRAHRTINPDGLSLDEFSATTPQSIAWAAANAAGLVKFCTGEYREADKLLRKALQHVQELTSSGLAQDAYCDLAACLSDVAVNELKWKGESEEAVSMLKRALYMAERAYRPNFHLIESLRSNLAVAYLDNDPEQARAVVERSVKTRDAVQLTLADGSAGMTSNERCGHARSLAVWAAVLARTGQLTAAVQAAERAHQQLEQDLGPDSVDTGRAAMGVGLLHWLCAERRVSEADESSHRAAALERYLAAAEAMRRGGLRAAHPDTVAAEVGVLQLEQEMLGKEAVKERRRRCMAAVRRLELREGERESQQGEGAWADGRGAGREDGEEGRGAGGGRATPTLRRVLEALKQEKRGVQPVWVPLLRSGLGLQDLMRDAQAQQRGRRAGGHAAGD